MKAFLRNYFVCFVALFALAWLMPNVSLGFPTGSSFTWEAFVAELPIIIVATLVMALLMTLVKPSLKVITLPINFLTLGLFSLVINVFLVWLATYLVPGFQVGPLEIFGVNLGQFGGMLVFSFFFSLIQSFLLVLF